MELILIALIFLILFWPRGGSTDTSVPEQAAYKKTCPPHKWNYVFIEGEEGERMRCDVCKKRPGELL